VAGFFARFRPSSLYALLIKGFISRGFFGDVLNSGELAPASIEGNTIFPPFDPEAAIDLLVENGTAYACSSKIARTVKSIDWAIRDISTGDINENHPANKLIERPHPLYSWAEQNELLIMNRIATGNHFLRKNVVDSGKIIEWLEPISPINVGIIPSRTDFIQFYEFQGSGTNKFKIPREEIIHFRYSIDPKNAYFGLSPLKSIQKVIQTDNSALEFQKFGLDNRSGKGLVFRLKRKLEKKQFEDLTALMKKNHQSAKNNGVPYMLGADFEQPTEIGNSLSELEFRDSRGKLQDETCGVLSVPRVLITPTDATFSNMTEARKLFIDEAVVPTLTDIRDTLNTGISDIYPDVFFDFDKIKIQEMKGELKTKSETSTRFFNMGYTRNEINDRLGLGFENTKSGDISHLPANLMPASELSLIDEDDNGNTA